MNNYIIDQEGNTQALSGNKEFDVSYCPQTDKFCLTNVESKVSIELPIGWAKEIKELIK